MKKYIPIIGFILAVAWMVVIFCFSAQSSDTISGTSRTITNFIINLFIGDKFNGYSLEMQQKTITYISYFLTKIAHFCEYGILCYFCFLVLIRLKKYNLRYIISVLICILYAISDELHQTMSIGRTPRVFDVLIDSLGAITMILVIEIFITIRHIIRIGKKND